MLSKKGSTAVTFITWLSACAMMVAVASMFIIVSVFSGLEVLNQDLISNLHADLTITSKTGKTLPDLATITKKLAANKNIAHFSKVIDEKVYIDYNDVGEIAYLRGVDSAYTSVNPINKSIFYGTYPSFKYVNEVLMESQLDDRLEIPVNSKNASATLMMPKSGVGMISKEADIFNKKDIYVTGIFPGNDQLNNYIISPLELAQELLSLPKNSAYSIVIKLQDASQADQIKNDLQNSLGNKVVIKTQKEENAAFWKMINTEKFFIYLIFALVIFITTFNLAGAIIILQLDKKEQAKSLISLGFPVRSLRMVYFYTGLLIVLFGIIAGLILGTLVSFLQIETGFFKAGATLPFPVKIIWQNYLIVSLTAGFFGILVSLIFSKINKRNIINS